MHEALIGILILNGYSYCPAFRVNPVVEVTFSLTPSEGNTV